MGGLVGRNGIGIAIASLIVFVLSVFVIGQRQGPLSLVVYTICFVSMLASGLVVGVAFLVGIGTLFE